MNGHDSASEELVSLIEEVGLQNLPLVGAEFTFFENGMDGARSRLDIFLIRDLESGWLVGICHGAILKFL